jgi:hypothetical protein
MSTGWTWDYVLNSMDLPRLFSLMDYWKQWPPLHKMVASYFGLGKSLTAPTLNPKDMEAQIPSLIADIARLNGAG